jgi:hypothetical protein
LAVNCTRSASLLRAEGPFYAGAPCVDAVSMPGVGHDINLHPSAPRYRAEVIGWADRVVAGA